MMKAAPLPLPSAFHASALITATPESPSLFSPRRLLFLIKQSPDHRSISAAHAASLKSGLASATTTCNHLLNAYVCCGAPWDARNVLDEMAHTANVVSYSSLISGLSRHGRPDCALSLFLRMPRTATPPNAFTLSAVLAASSALADAKAGKQIHALVESYGFRSDVVVSTSLIDMYAKCNRVGDARKVFDGTEARNVVSWGAMISACAQNAHGHEAICLFGEFLRLDLSPNHFVLSAVINACASVGRVGAGKCVHAAVMRRGYQDNDVSAAALVDMYAKCGCVEQSMLVFRGIQQPTVVPYTSMIVASAKYGLVDLALGLFAEMLDRRIVPNEVTFLGLLHACSHSGLVDKGLEHLEAMQNQYGLLPNTKHYTCIVDMLGRAGRLDEAHGLLKEVRAEGHEALLLWTSLLSAARKHGRVDLVAEAGYRLEEFSLLGGDVAGAYVIMSNAYASSGDWEAAEEMRSAMRRQGIRKDRGCSWVEIKDVAYVFYAGDASSCGREKEVVRLLRDLEVRMREKGYVGGGSGSGGVVVNDVEGEELAVGAHSERLALAFGLLSTPDGSVIRVMKNLRICHDCHEAFKLISEIVRRRIVVRDLNRFHHFHKGICTCGDYW